MFVSGTLGRTLAAIAESDGEAFYRGRLAAAINRAASAAGGLRASDLAAYQPQWATPIVQPYRGVDVAELPPNGQGLAAQIALAILAELDVAEQPGSAEWTHLQAEAMKIAIRAAFDHFADSRAMTVPPTELLAPDAIRRAAASVGHNARPLPPALLPGSEDTVYLAAADTGGMMVSLIQSNYMGFGSGIVVPDTGISLQNRGAGFSLQPGHPNQVAPGKRPYHTIIPGFVTRADGPLLAYGVMGGHMQHQGHVQMVTRIFDHGENPQAACDAPRWHVTPDYRLLLEEGYDESVANELAARGHDVAIGAPHGTFGGAQLVYRLPTGGYFAASDHRKEGAAVGF